MNLNWSNRVIKYVLFVFNLLFVISGIIMIAVGVSVKAYYTDYDIFLSERYFSLPNLLIAIGSLIFFISFFGCCGAIRENWFMIFIFSILLSIIFIMEFSAGIAGYVLRDSTVSYLEEELQTSMKEYKFNTNDTKNCQVTIMWDTIQEEFQCCGVNGPKDWPASRVWPSTVTPPTTVPVTTKNDTKTTSGLLSSTNESSSESITKTTGTPNSSTTTSTTTTTTSNSSSTTNSDTTDLTNPDSIPTAAKLFAADEHNDLPFSCCKTKPGASGRAVCNLDDEVMATYYKKGCIVGFGDYLKEHAVTLGGVGIAIAFIQLFGVIFACHLARQLKHGFYST